MAVSRETVLFYEPEGGAQGALLKSILVRMGVRIKNGPQRKRWGRQLVVCWAARDLTRGGENPEAPVLAEPGAGDGWIYR